MHRARKRVTRCLYFYAVQPYESIEKCRAAVAPQSRVCLLCTCHNRFATIARVLSDTASQSMGKKRKADGDLDAERSLQNTFVTAANSISQLLTLAVQQNKRSRTEGAVDALVRRSCVLALALLCVGR